MSKRSKATIRTKEDKDSLRAKVLSWLGNIIGVKIVKTTPRHVGYVFQPEPIIRKPLFDYVNLFEVATTSWPLRRAFKAIIQECTRNRWTKQPKFKHKCIACGKEYNVNPKGKKCTVKDEKGKVCGGKLREPSVEQGKLFDQILDKPNPDYHFDDFVRSSLFYGLALDDWYWGIAYKETPRIVKDKDGLPKTVIKDDEAVMDKLGAEIYIEDARFMFPIADEYGHLGGYEYFCPICYDKEKHLGDHPVVEILPNMTLEQQEALKKCQYCGGEMKQTAYVQEAAGQILARFTKDEIVHGSTSRVLPSLFGNSRIISVWTLVQTVLAMDGYNYEVYSEGKVGALIGMPGYDQLEVGRIKEEIETELKKLDRKDITTGRYRTSKKIRILMMGLKKDTEASRIPLMEDLKGMQSIDFYRMYIDAIAEMYGVTTEFVATGAEVGLGAKFKIEVQNRTVQGEQNNFVDLFNSEALPKFGITDWILAFNPVEPRNELKVAQVHQTRAAAAFTYLRGGFSVNIGADGELIVSGKGEIKENEPEGSRAREDRAMGGKPWRWEYGEGSRSQGQQVEDMAKALVGIPISWHTLTQIRLWDRIYAVDQEKDDVYITINGKEVRGTRTKAANFNVIIANLVNYIMDYMIRKLEADGFDNKALIEGRRTVVLSLRRGLGFKGLINLANYLDSINQSPLAEKIDNLRMRLEKVIHDALDVQPDGIEPLPGTDSVRKDKVKARVPYGAKHEEKTLFEQLEKLVGKANKKNKKKTIKEAKKIIDKSYEELKEHSLNRVRRRTKKKNISLSPEEEKSLKLWKKDALEDFKKILEDSIKGVRKE